MTARKLAVVVRNRQGEALRMALGLTLADDTVDVFVLDQPLPAGALGHADQELMREMGMHLYSNHAGNAGMEPLSTEEIARRLVDYDHVLPY